MTSSSRGVIPIVEINQQPISAMATPAPTPSKSQHAMMHG